MINKKNFFYIFSIIVTNFLLCSCIVGPNYKTPCVYVPTQYKEAPEGFKIAEPQDCCIRGRWWTIFHNPELNALEERLTIGNQNIAVAEAQFREARALVDEARASYFPTVTSSLSITRQRSASQRSGGTLSTTGTTTSTSSGGSGVTDVTRSNNAFTSESLVLNASWEPDLWGGVHRQVEANCNAAQASVAELAAVRLSAEASLAQYYFELRGLDNAQKILDNTVKDYKESLRIVLNRYRAGVVSRTDVIQAQTQLESAEAAALNNGINRAKYEHAIAMLIGVPASNFCLSYYPHLLKPPYIPLEIPTCLLERRPDVAQAERLAAQANAQIGVAIAAFFPNLTLNAQGIASGIGSIGQWLAAPAIGWAVGPQLAATILDGGLRSATVCASKANYLATVATYRQTVLAAFQDVEDNLASLRILKEVSVVQNKAALDARRAVKLIMNQYKAGTVSYTDVLTAQNTAFTAEKNASDVEYLRMTAAVGLIKALGGDWDISKLKGKIKLTTVPYCCDYVKNK